MKVKWIRSFSILFITGILSTCIEPFDRGITGFQSLLVVDALLTNRASYNCIKLTRTKETSEEPPEKVKGAVILIRDDTGNETAMNEVFDGVYKPENPTYSGLPGREYTLYIRTPDGSEYLSDPVIMPEERQVDTLYFGKDSEWLPDGTIQEGVRVYIDSKDHPGNPYYRWTYEEWWEFNAPTPKLFEYRDRNHITEIPIANITCWKNNISKEIQIESSETGSGTPIIKKPVLFIPSEESDRLLVQYCIEVSQFSISRSEYEYWDQLKQISEAGGDIFDKQPFNINGNIHSLSRSGEQVLGYFQVSSVSTRKEYLTRKEIDKMNLPRYFYECEMAVVGPGDPETDIIGSPVTFDMIYWYFTVNGYIFIQPVYNDENKLERLMFVKNSCSDCRLTGSPVKPDFWTDMK